MSLNETTLSGAIGASDTTIGVASATGITAPTSTTGSGNTLLMVENEMMSVTAVSGTQISVVRGVNGTRAVAHGVTTGVIAGNVGGLGGSSNDFPNFAPNISAFTTPPSGLPRYQGASSPVASASTIVASGSVFHVTGTTTLETITPPGTDFLEGTIRIIFDGVAAWGTSGNIAVAGTPTTAGSYVDFYFDGAKQKWYPSRLA